jgi:plastocyanin
MRVLSLLGAVVIVTGCGGGGGGGGGTPPPPQVASVTITPSSAQATSLCGDLPFSAQARDAAGGALSRTISWSATPTTSIALSSTTGQSITATGVAVGTSTVRASADDVPSTGVLVTVSAGGQAPPTASVTASSTANTFTPGCVVIATGGTVTWTFGTLAHDVDFSGANAPADIPQRTSTTESRTFSTAGSFPYRCTLHPGMNGQVIVQ